MKYKYKKIGYDFLPELIIYKKLKTLLIYFIKLLLFDNFLLYLKKS